VAAVVRSQTYPLVGKAVLSIKSMPLFYFFYRVNLEIPPYSEPRFGSLAGSSDEARWRKCDS